MNVCSSLSCTLLDLWLYMHFTSSLVVLPFAAALVVLQTSECEMAARIWVACHKRGFKTMFGMPEAGHLA